MTQTIVCFITTEEFGDVVGVEEGVCDHMTSWLASHSDALLPYTRVEEPEKMGRKKKKKNSPPSAHREEDDSINITVHSLLKKSCFKNSIRVHIMSCII